MRKKIRGIISIVGIVLLLAIGLLCVLLRISFGSALEPVQDPKRYEEVLAEYDGGPKVIAHFPSHIPDTATEVTLYYMPRFLQGGSRLWINYKLPASELATIAERYRPIAQWIGDGGSFNIPKGFEVFYLNDSNASDWNGYVYGVAVNLECQEIIYWAEDVRT